MASIKTNNGIAGLWLLAVWLLSGCGTAMQQGREVAVAFYNCENFFGMAHTPGRVDSGFTAGGEYHYTQSIYEQKLHNIATVIQTMNGGKGPAIMGLVEVENGAVLNDLVHQPEIVRRNYKYVITDGPDERGINVALLYDPQRFAELSAERLHVALDDIEPGAKTRDVLHVTGTLDGDTVHVFVNHWPSRRGGEQSAAKRMRAAVAGRQAMDELLQQAPDAAIIFMGDFNDNPPDSSITEGLHATGDTNALSATGLYDPWAAVFSKGQGTEEFDKQWNLFDQVMVSAALLHHRGGKLHYEKAEVYHPAFLMEHKKGHEGEPRRSFAGTHWMNGYSDHFPVMLYLNKN